MKQALEQIKILCGYVIVAAGQGKIVVHLFNEQRFKNIAIYCLRKFPSKEANGVTACSLRREQIYVIACPRRLIYDY